MEGTLWRKLKPRAGGLRHESTAAEDLLWSGLRGRRLLGLKFRRQHAIGQFVVDFCCPEKMLVIEVDGPIHDGQVDEDRYREQELAVRGFRVLRLRNEDVLGELGNALARIETAVTGK